MSTNGLAWPVSNVAVSYYAAAAVLWWELSHTRARQLPERSEPFGRVVELAPVWRAMLADLQPGVVCHEFGERSAGPGGRGAGPGGPRVGGDGGEEGRRSVGGRRQRCNGGGVDKVEEEKRDAVLEEERSGEAGGMYSRVKRETK